MFNTLFYLILYIKIINNKLQFRYHFTTIKYFHRLNMISKFVLNHRLFFASMYPKFNPLTGTLKQKILVIHEKQAGSLVPEKYKDDFKKNKKVEVIQNERKITIVSEKSVLKEKIGKDAQIQFSQQLQKQTNFLGIATSLLQKPYKFSRKQKSPDQIQIQSKQFNDKDYVLELVSANLRARQWVNMRGDQADPEFFLKKAQQLANQYKLKLTVIKGTQLLNQGFRLMHAVGRASQKQPIFINLSYNGNPESQEWTAFIGKGVCFDSGGLNLKPTSGIKEMHMDKHGAASILSSIQSIAKLNLKANVTASMGFVQNFVSSNSYRPLDIIKSRKGITVQIGNTDAQGRLVLADCMNWTQQKYKVKNMIQLSTLTGAIIIALGKKHAGLFSNSDQLSKNFIQAGKQVSEQNWRMPVDEYHHDLIKSKHADITNSPGKSEASSCQAAAFLQKFVQKDVNWIHLDIAGTSNIDSQATGFGSKTLINYAKNFV